MFEHRCFFDQPGMPPGFWSLTSDFDDFDVSTLGTQLRCLFFRRGKKPRDLPFAPGSVS